MVLSKHFFSEAGSIRHHKQEGLQPSLVALFKHCKQPGSKGFCFVLTSAGMGYASEIRKCILAWLKTHNKKLTKMEHAFIWEELKSNQSPYA